MEFGSVEYQLAIWNLFNLGRIGSAMATIGTILAIWLSLRIAVNTRNNPETNLFAKIISTAFGLVVLAASWIQATIAATYWTNTAGAFANIKSIRMWKSILLCCKIRSRSCKYTTLICIKLGYAQCQCPCNNWLWFYSNYSNSLICVLQRVF